MERYELRTIRQDEMEQGVAIELACFPPNEACSEKSMRERVQYAPELFLAAVDKETGKIRRNAERTCNKRDKIP